MFSKGRASIEILNLLSTKVQLTSAEAFFKHPAIPMCPLATASRASGVAAPGLWDFGSWASDEGAGEVQTS